MIFSIDAPERREQVALVDAAADISWTYSQLSQEIQRRCDLFRSRQRGLLFHFCENDLSSAAWYLSALEADVPIVLLSGQLNPVLRNELIALYRPEWVIAPQTPDAESYVRSESEVLWQSTAPCEQPTHPQLAVLLSTSGSTGSPKLVRLSRRNVEANAESIRAALEIDSNHFPVAHLPLHYSYGLSVLNSHLLAGAKILLTNLALTTSAFWDGIRRHNANSFSGVPYTYQMLRRLDLDKVNVPSLLTFTQAGGKLDPANIDFFHQQVSRRGGSFWVMYGQTEATARMTILPASELPRKLGSAGKAIPGGKLSIKADDGHITTAAEIPGELVYEGPNVMMGYAQQRQCLSLGDELSGRLETGDRASLDEEGFVYIYGRTKRDAKVFGLRVNLDELEAFAKKSGPAAAVAAPNGVVIFCEFGNEHDLQNIRKDLAAFLRIHSSAIEFRHLDRLPTKASGKIDYEQLQRML